MHTQLVNKNNNKLHKQLIREQIIRERKAFDEYQYQQANNKIYKNTLEVINNRCPKFFDDAKALGSNKHYIGLYWPLKGEPDLLRIAIVANSYMGLPKILETQQMIFAKYHLGDPVSQSLIPNLYQPTATFEVFPDIIIIPSLALSISGYRLGFGQGYYDRYLSIIKASNAVITVGVCFHQWLMEYIPYEIFDHKLDYVITDQYVIKT